MKNIFISLSTALLAVSSLHLSATTLTADKIEFKPTRTMELMAQEFGFTDTKEYLRAAQTYIRISQGKEPLQFKPVNEIQSIQELVLYIDSEQDTPRNLKTQALNDYNTEQAKFANQLGLKVSQLNEFMRAFADLSGTGQYKHIKVDNHPSSFDDDNKGSPEAPPEIIRVRCGSECHDHASSTKDIEFMQYIGYLARKANIPQTIGRWHNPFTVEYINDQGHTLLQERWTHNNISGGQYKQEPSALTVRSQI